MICLRLASSIRNDLAKVGFDLIDRFHVCSVKTRHQRQTLKQLGFETEALATATGKAAYD